MDLNRIIQDLKAERDTLAATIECLEQECTGTLHRRSIHRIVGALYLNYG